MGTLTNTTPAKTSFGCICTISLKPYFLLLQKVKSSMITEQNGILIHLGTFVFHTIYFACKGNTFLRKIAVKSNGCCTSIFFKVKYHGCCTSLFLLLDFTLKNLKKTLDFTAESVLTRESWRDACLSCRGEYLPNFLDKYSNVCHPI